VPRVVDHRHVAHQQIPAGALHRGEEAVAEKTREALVLLDPGLEVDARLAGPGVAQAAVVGRTGPDELAGGERGGEVGRIGRNGIETAEVEARAREIGGEREELDRTESVARRGLGGGGEPTGGILPAADGHRQGSLRSAALALRLEHDDAVVVDPAVVRAVDGEQVERLGRSSGADLHLGAADRGTALDSRQLREAASRLPAPALQRHQVRPAFRCVDVRHSPVGAPPLARAVGSRPGDDGGALALALRRLPERLGGDGRGEAADRLQEGPARQMEVIADDPRAIGGVTGREADVVRRGEGGIDRNEPVGDLPLREKAREAAGGEGSFPIEAMELVRAGAVEAQQDHPARALLGRRRRRSA
jgi:hypothetical protein